MSSEQADQASPAEAAAALPEILRLVETGKLGATPGLQRLIQGAAIGLDKDARQSEDYGEGPEANG